jgi:hypothetical protein
MSRTTELTALELEAMNTTAKLTGQLSEIVASAGHATTT